VEQRNEVFFTARRGNEEIGTQRRQSKMSIGIRVLNPVFPQQGLYLFRISEELKFCLPKAPADLDHLPFPLEVFHAERSHGGTCLR